MLEVCLHPYVGHLHLLDMRTDSASCFSAVGCATLQRPLAHVNWFLLSGVGRPRRVYMTKFGNLKVLLKGRCSLLSHVGRQVRIVGASG